MKRAGHGSYARKNLQARMLVAQPEFDFYQRDASLHQKLP
jgi:hypothetical protein